MGTDLSIIVTNSLGTMSDVVTNPEVNSATLPPDRAATQDADRRRVMLH